MRLTSGREDTAANSRRMKGQAVLGPVFPLELVTTVRRIRFYVVRASYGGMLLLVLWLSYHGAFRLGEPSSIRSAARFGELFFDAFGTLQLLAAVILAAASCA